MTNSEIFLLAATLVFVALVTAVHLTRVTGPSQGRYTVTPQQNTPQPQIRDVLIDINTADAETLQSLPGIGAAMAERIVADREANGPFADLKDLTRISGIGEKTVEAIAPYAIAGDTGNGKGDEPSENTGGR